MLSNCEMEEEVKELEEELEEALGVAAEVEDTSCTVVHPTNSTFTGTLIHGR